MGTRADFYVGTGETAEWLGSVTWDGYPGGFDTPFWNAQSEQDYRALIADVAEERDDWTDADEGWPWPWNTSQTTDYAYAWDGEKVVASIFGRPFFVVKDGEPEDEEYFDQGKEVLFPVMKNRRMPHDEMMNRSGLVVIEASE